LFAPVAGLGPCGIQLNPGNADLPIGEPGLVSWLKRTLGFDAQAREQHRVASTRFHRACRWPR